MGSKCLHLPYCFSWLHLHQLIYSFCSGHGVCPSLQFTTEAFSWPRPRGGHLLVQSAWTAAGSSALHQSHRWGVVLSFSCMHASSRMVENSGLMSALFSFQTSGRSAAFLRSCLRLSPYSTVVRKISRPATLTTMTSWTASLTLWASLLVRLFTHPQRKIFQRKWLFILIMLLCLYSTSFVVFFLICEEM